jgi:anti-sigma regulatory factor (Ser/Thr protein kinase)
MFRSDGTHLYFINNGADDIFPVSAALYNLVNRQGYKDIILDFSQCTFLDVKFMLPVVTAARWYRGEKVDFELILPTDQSCSRLLVNANWAHLITPEKYEARDDRNKNHLSAIQYTNANEQNDAVNRSIDVILRSIGGLDRPRLKALEWSLNEITDNVLNHSESSVGGIVQVVTYAKKQAVEFLVCDAGIGIPRSLRQGRPEYVDDVRALRAAIEEGVTRNKATNQGNGLYGTFRCCEVSGGDFDAISGNVILRHRETGLHVSRNNIPIKGTFIRASINYSFEQLLERALVFKGKAHDPGADYIERVYQSHGDDINFRVVQELDAFGTREAGKLARTKIENLMDRGRAPIVFDFDEVHLISSSFADEVFGKLFSDLGPLRFGQLCKFKNVDSTVQTLIDRAITQRIRQS